MGIFSRDHRAGGHFLFDYGGRSVSLDAVGPVELIDHEFALVDEDGDRVIFGDRRYAGSRINEAFNPVDVNTEWAFDPTRGKTRVRVCEDTELEPFDELLGHYGSLFWRDNTTVDRDTILSGYPELQEVLQAREVNPKALATRVTIFLLSIGPEGRCAEVRAPRDTSPANLVAISRWGPLPWTHHFCVLKEGNTGEATWSEVEEYMDEMHPDGLVQSPRLFGIKAGPAQVWWWASWVKAETSLTLSLR